MIPIIKITPPTVELYDPNDKFVRTINEYELLAIRVHIKKSGLSGYYIKFNQQNIRIDRNGELEEYPKGLLDTMSNYLLQLI